MMHMYRHWTVAATGRNASADNLWALKKYCAKSFEGNTADIDAFFKQQGYSADMDYV